MEKENSTDDIVDGPVRFYWMEIVWINIGTRRLLEGDGVEESGVDKWKRCYMTLFGNNSTSRGKCNFKLFLLLSLLFYSSLFSIFHSSSHWQ